MSLTVILLIITVVVSLIAESNADLKFKLLFNAHSIKYDKEWYRWITHGFVHGGVIHLLINMWVFYNFGEIVEKELAISFGGLGTGIYILLYVGGFIVSSLSSYFKHQENPSYNSLGASGGVASVLFSFILFYPTHSLMLLFLPGVPIPAFVLGLLYLWYENYMSKRGGTGIAHDAHFWGAVYGIVLITVIDYKVLVECMGQIRVFISSLFA
jgi:membrane associated rhomboid family serine protease